MPAKLPAKFDDVSKTASSVLGDDFQCAGFQLKSKQVSNFGGATSELTVDYAPTADTKTPTKMSFKFPKPAPMLEGLAIDKLDLDKNGVIKMETSLSKALHKVDGLKIEAKTDFAKSTTYHTTFTGVQDTIIKFDTKHSAPQDFTLELVRGVGPAVVGAKLSGLTTLCPDVGASYTHGDFFASVIAKNQFKEFTTHGLYTASKDIKVAATYQQGGKKSGAWTVGGTTVLPMDLSAKAKFDGSLVSVALKKDLAKGTKLFGGVSYNVSGGDITYGAKLAIE
jgi:hypothetical protein